MMGEGVIKAIAAAVGDDAPVDQFTEGIEQFSLRPAAHVLQQFGVKRTADDRGNIGARTRTLTHARNAFGDEVAHGERDPGCRTAFAHLAYDRIGKKCIAFARLKNGVRLRTKFAVPDAPPKKLDDIVFT